MTGGARDLRLHRAFTALAEALTSEYDVLAFLDALLAECLGLLDVQAAGLLLANAQGELELVASTSEGAALVEVLQLGAGDGPCIACVRSGGTVSIADVDADGEWADFRLAARQQGLRSAHAVPLRIRSQVIGSMGLFRTSAGALGDVDAELAGAFANLASLGIVQERVLRESAIVTEQLQRALESRVLIEQAKGVLAAQADVDVEQAFRMLRDHARRNSLNLHAVARAVVDRAVELPRPARVAPSGEPATH